VSAARFFGIICFSASLYAQFSAAPGVSVTGELRSHGDTASNEFLVEIYDARTNHMIERVPVNRGQFELDNVPVGSYTIRLVTAPGEAPIVEEFHQFEPGGAPLVLDLPERASDKPISGIVSLRDLEHPIPQKALREAYEAQQFARANNLPKAIAKLESAIRIYPAYRDAHVNLGAEYARAGRIADARAEFQKALDIGPPVSAIYADLALISVALHQNREAEEFARKSLELDATNPTARKVLGAVAQH
jgi:tetratricopeptide (TPR) repeat protein